MSATFADNGGVRIAYESFGEGPPLLLMQGHRVRALELGPVVPALAERFRVLNFDNRGIGESDVPPAPYTARQLAEDGLAVLDDAGVERAHVVGASLGGMAAQELAAGFPDRVDRLVLACTTPGGTGAVPMPAQTVALMQEAADARARGRDATLRRERARAECRRGAHRRALRAACRQPARPHRVARPGRRGDGLRRLCGSRSPRRR